MGNELEAQRVLSREDLAALPIARDVEHLVGANSVVITRPSNKTLLVLVAESGTIRLRVGDNATRTFADTDITVGTDEITITGHGLNTGDGPFLFNDGGGTTPTGLTEDTVKYWIVAVDNNTVQLATSKENAEASTPTVVDITAAGSGAGMTLSAMPAAAAPAASVVNGMGAMGLLEGTAIVMSAPAVITAQGYVAGDILTYYWV